MTNKAPPPASAVSSSRRFPSTDLYCITASEYSLGRSNLEVVGQMLQEGVKLLQYREKDFTMAQKYRECLAIRELCTRYNACFIVNDDVHLAMAVGADGVHLGQEDLPVQAARALVGDRMLIGLSTHSPQQADQAATLGVDYIGVGPIYHTTTKKGVGAAVGLGYLDYVVAHHRMPFVAIGGIKEHNVADVAAHGARCVAMVTEIVGAPDIPARIRALRSRMASAGS